MKNLVIYEGYDLKGDLILVKSLRNFSDFKEGIRVFQNPPYSEILTDQDCEKEFYIYQDNGIVFGCFGNDNLAGINCILNGAPDEYGIAFYNSDRVAYYSGLAVKENFRKRGLGKLLVKETEKYLGKFPKYDYSFARILCDGSMSEGIFKANGFKDAYYNNELIVDDVTYERNDKNVSRTDQRKYMVKTLNSNCVNGWYRR